MNLAESIRRYGHLAATIDPLGSTPVGDPSLHAETHGVTDAELRQLPASLVGGPLAEGAANAAEAIERLRRVYCSSIGFDLAHIFVPEEREWLRHHVEAGTFRAPTTPVEDVDLLERITEVETFEKFLHKAFPGKTRFSIEGLDVMVPILDEIIADSADAGVRHVLIGMAHRGRLNVLAHVMRKTYAQILAEFKEAQGDQPFREDLGWTGDVKYHAGARARVREEDSAPEVVISMPPNPSHLEFVNPVVVGMARAACTDTSAPGPPAVDKGITLPVLIHGDAAFPGQGIVAETLNLSRLRLYDVGGTVHIIANNQIGFTATARQSYSTSYASGLARGFKIPIFHVNADDPEACIEVARLTAEYRAQFKRDTLIDLVGYRRHGHNEGDEPSFTQPAMYRIINAHPTVREIWAQRLVERGRVTPEQAEAFVTASMAALEQALETVKRNAQPKDEYPEPPPRGVARQARTAVSARTARGAQRGRSPRCRSASPSTRSWSACATSGGRVLDTARRARRWTGPRPRTWRLPRSSRTASASGSPAKTSSAAPSATATRCFTTSTPATATCRCSGSRRPRPRSRSTTARSPSARPSASRSATTCRRRAGWWCGKRSTATSSTARR